MNNAKKALVWIADILKKYQIPFQITGGLAAMAYGANRPLADIDIEIPDNQFDRLIEDVKPYITFGPERFKSNKWDLILMTLKYKGQDIDVSGSDSTHIFNDKIKKWILLSENLSISPFKKIFDLDLPTIPLDKLIFYKKILARDVDLIDIQQIEINRK